jgi:hypothetical protein
MLNYKLSKNVCFSTSVDRDVVNTPYPLNTYDS